MSDLITTKELAKLEDVSLTTIQMWVREGLVPDKPGGGGRPNRYDHEKVRAWLEARASGTGPDGLRSSGANARRKKDEAQAALAEQLYKTRAGELVPAEDVEKVWSAHVLAVRTQVLATYKKQARRLYQAAGRGLPDFKAELEAVAVALLEDLAASVED